MGVFFFVCLYLEKNRAVGSAGRRGRGTLSVLRVCVDKQTAQSERELLGGVDVETQENLSTALSDSGGVLFLDPEFANLNNSETILFKPY
jgi:hypothetical protein